MSMRFTICALVVLLIALAIPIVTPATLIRQPEDSKSRSCSVRPSGWAPRYHRYMSHGDMNTHPSLSKRAHSLQIHHMQLHSMTVPVIQAASALAFFYSNILRECASKWTHNPPVYVLRITNGFFALELRSTSSPVPWALVAEVASNMLAVTEMGFTGTYDIWYRDQRFMMSGIGVMVRFRIWYPNARAGVVVVDTPLGRLPT